VAEKEVTFIPYFFQFLLRLFRYITRHF